jgi:hypothetical protein
MTPSSAAPVAPSPSSCPPYHWLVIDHAPRVQHWTCYRCGAEHRPEWVAPEDAYANWAQRQRAKRTRSNA